LAGALAGLAVLVLVPAPATSACIGTTALSAISDPGRLLAFYPPTPWFAHWLAMIAAMMLPLAVPMAAYVELRSFPRRRAAMVAAFLLGHTAIWFAAGVTFYAMTLAALAAPRAVLGLMIAASLIWQLHPARALALAACHRTGPLAAHGSAAIRSASTFGLTLGTRCVASCWQFMLPVLGGADHLLLMAAAVALSLHERSSRRLEPRTGAAVLALCWMVALV
jgi:hypothetical protein